MPKAAARKAVRRAVRKNPTLEEATQMLYDLYDIDYWASEARDVGDSYARVEMHDEDPRMPGAGTFTFERVLPTVMVIKLGAAVENALDVLWSRRFPEVKPRTLRYEDKVAVMEKVHQVELSAFRELWKLRNKCAHTVKFFATWGEFEAHYKAVSDFVDRFPTESKRKKR